MARKEELPEGEWPSCARRSGDLFQVIELMDDAYVDSKADDVDEAGQLQPISDLVSKLLIPNFMCRWRRLHWPGMSELRLSLTIRQTSRRRLSRNVPKIAFFAKMFDIV